MAFQKAWVLPFSVNGKWSDIYVATYKKQVRLSIYKIQKLAMKPNLAFLEIIAGISFPISRWGERYLQRELRSLESLRQLPI